MKHGGITMKQGFALAALAVLAITVGAVAIAEPVRVQAAAFVQYILRLPGSPGEIAIGGNVAIRPLAPTYLPDPLKRLAVTLSGTAGSESIQQAYHNGDQFVAITQSKASGVRGLPDGRRVTVNGQPAVLVTGLKGTMELAPRIPEGAQVKTFGTPAAELANGQPSPLAYTDGKRLTWYAGDTRVEVLSNLSEEEVLRVAASLKPTDEGQGLNVGAPQPAQETSSAADGGVLRQEGRIGPKP